MLNIDKCRKYTLIVCSMHRFQICGKKIDNLYVWGVAQFIFLDCPFGIRFNWVNFDANTLPNIFNVYSMFMFIWVYRACLAFYCGFCGSQETKVMKNKTISITIFLIRMIFFSIMILFHEHSAHTQHTAVIRNVYWSTRTKLKFARDFFALILCTPHALLTYLYSVQGKVINF